MGAALKIVAAELPETADQQGDGSRWRLRTSDHIRDLPLVLYYVGEAELTGAIVLSPDPDHARTYATPRAAYWAALVLKDLVPLVLEPVPQAEGTAP
jgi:hypothetical protein